MPALIFEEPLTVKETLIDEEPPVVLAQLESINFARLLQDDPAESEKLLRACQTHGFFYLDLLSKSADGILDNYTSVLRVMSEWFDQPLEKKMEFDNGSTATHGYKPSGTQSGVHARTKDGFEALRFARNELQTATPTENNLPANIQPHLDLFQAFTAACHKVTLTILARLSETLHPNTPFTASHKPTSASKTNLVLLHYPASTNVSSEVGQNKHTDIGTLTLLFTTQWGLQVISPHSGKWENVAPIPGHAIINVGDCLRFMSGKKVRSALHRVVPFMGRQEERWSVAWFLRPENGTVMEGADGERVEVAEWHDRKFGVYHEGHEAQQKSRVLLGGMEEVVGAV